MGVEPTTVWSEIQHDNHSAMIVVNFLGIQIKYKYKRRVDEGAKWYPVRVLLI